ncbi:MAG: hypothetical protein AAGD33_19765 [Actinomycetota bacterium]
MGATGFTRLAALFVVPVLVGACGGDASTTAVAVIETELRDQIGLGDLEAECDQPEEAIVGEVFECTATTNAGDSIDFVAEFEEDDQIFVYPTNIVEAASMPNVEAAAAAALSGEVGEPIDAGDVSCPDETVVLDAAESFPCEIARAATGQLFELTVTLTDFVRDEGFQNVRFQVGDEITG